MLSANTFCKFYLTKLVNKNLNPNQTKPIVFYN